MRVKTFDELTADDERVVHIPQLDPTTGTLAPASTSLMPIQCMIADCDLVPAIPEHVRAQFERCRMLHTYGCFAYDLFTVAAQHAYFALEAALGARFLTYYPSGVPLENTRRSGATDQLHPAFFNEISAALRHDGTHPRGKGWIVVGHPRFDGLMKSLLAWARAERLLDGQRNRVVEGALHRLRNLAAHPHGPLLLPPGESAAVIRDIAEIINRLWGQFTPGGRLYGTPLEMSLIYAHWSPDGSREVGHAEGLLRLGEVDRRDGGRWVLLEAADPDEAFSWSPNYETTVYPTTLVWHGNSWEGAAAAWTAYQVEGCHPQPREWRGRYFLVRHGGAQGPELPRLPMQFRSLAPADWNVPGTQWGIVRADHPGDVPLAWQDRASVAALFATLDREELFPAHLDTDGTTWEEAEVRLRTLGV